MSSEDTGDSSSSQGTESPYSSPSQQVPHLNNFIMGLSFGGNEMDTDASISKKPFLIITEQPCDHFRFRYISEMVGTHGCISGKTSNTNRNKTYPSVELMNYRESAIIKCHLAQHNNDKDHPHQLVEDEQDSDVKAKVGPVEGYGVSFQGMGIINMPKKDVPLALYKKLSETRGDTKQLRQECEQAAKKINLNIVRLKFSAHHIDTDEEICPPVFSEPIHNMKSAATNDLKICRMSRSSGKPRGGEDVFILTEKVNKKNIEVRFVEVDSKGNECWVGKGRFLPTDVHHQYAIVFRTPRYINPEITSDVKVYVELFRPSDGRTSDRLEFTYNAEEVFKQSKKRKNCGSNSYSSFGSSTGGSLKSVDLDNIPKAIFEQFNGYNQGMPTHNITISLNPIADIPQVPVQGSTADDLSSALLGDLTQYEQEPRMHLLEQEMAEVSPMLSQPNVPEPPVQYVSGDIERLLSANINEVEMRAFMNDVSTISEDYFGIISDDVATETFNFLNNSIQLSPDSGREKATTSSSQSPKQAPRQKPAINLSVDKDSEYKAFYTKQDGEEVKKLVKELCDMIRYKTQYKKKDVRTKLERLFELRLSNGDTFLHLTLHNNILSSMEYIVKLVHSLQMTHLLNKGNNRMLTVLHQAVINDLPANVPFLVSKGCDPMATDEDQNNVIHYAVMCKSCLGPLLDAIKLHKVSCDLNAVNKDKHTALHLAVMYRSEASADLLLKHGASANARDMSGRTALHVAAFDCAIRPAAAILSHLDHKDEVDAIDGQGHTALQIVCGSQPTEHTLAFVELLLKNMADPLRHEDHNEPAWKLARDNPQIRELMLKYVPATSALTDDEIKSEPEDEFESADEGDAVESGLEAMSAYIHELADILDRGGGWRNLAARLQCDSLVNWYEKTPSPTRTLLKQVKECHEEVTSVGLAKILRDLGEFEAANVILRYVDV